MQMVGDLAPVLEHMLPGDVQGHGSHQWMMQKLPGVLQHDWALELIGSMIKYPFAVEIFVDCVGERLQSPASGQAYQAADLVDVLLETVTRAALKARPEGKVCRRCRGQMAALDAQGVCRFQGLPRIMMKLGLLRSRLREATLKYSEEWYRLWEEVASKLQQSRLAELVGDMLKKKRVVVGIKIIAAKQWHAEKAKSGCHR